MRWYLEVNIFIPILQFYKWFFCLNNGSYADTTNSNIGVALDTLAVKIEEAHSFFTSCVLDLVTSQPNPHSKKNPLYTQQLFITKAFLVSTYSGTLRFIERKKIYKESIRYVS